MTKSVPFPEFELVGPPCRGPGCDGVLVDHLTTRDPKEFFRQCSVCGRDFDRVPAQEKLDETVRTIERIAEEVL